MVVDSREASLARLLPGAERACLACGDVTIGGLVVLERKTVADLAASIRDGRWRDQLARLRAAPAQGGRCAVVIEGALPGAGDVVGGVTGGAMMSALAGAFVRDGVAWFSTDGLAGTARLVEALADRAARNEPPSEQGGLPSCGIRLPKRGEALSDPRAVAAAQLCVIPGVSPAIAVALLGDCNGIAEWTRRWGGRLAELADLRVGPRDGSGGGGRRLGASLARRVARSCFGGFPGDGGAP